MDAARRAAPIWPLASAGQIPRKRQLTLVANEVVGPSIHILTFALDAGDTLEFVPGQYATFYLPKNGKTLTRSYSIFSSADLHDRLSFLIKEVPGGFGSGLLCGLSPADRPSLPALVPLGKFLLQDPGDRTVVLVATGVGLAPFVPMLERLRRDRPDTATWMFWGNRYEEDLVERATLEELARAWPSFHFVPILSRPPEGGNWKGAVGHVEEHVRSQFPDLFRCDVYLCGATPMVNQMQELSLELRCPQDRIFVDRWGEHA